MIKEILNENEKRRRNLSRPYDPIKGNPEDANRVRFTAPDIGDYYIPMQMLHELTDKGRKATRIMTATINGKTEKIPQISAAEFDRLRCRHDFPYWASKYAFIKRKGGGTPIPFVLNRPQRRLVNFIEQMRRKDQPIRIILLKARQWGASTCIQIFMSWLQLVHKKGLNSLIIAHCKTSSSEIKRMFELMLENYPEEMLDDNGPEEGDKEERATENKGKKKKTTQPDSLTLIVNPRMCEVKIGTALNPDSCRGGDYNLVHCSEVGLWKATKERKPEDIVRSACSGVLYEPMTMIVFESTANGTGTFFHSEYMAALKGKNQLKPLFVPWHMIPRYQTPFSDNREKEEMARRLLEGKESRQPRSDREPSGQYIWKLWLSGATLEGLNWYLCERAKHSDDAAMASEFPSDEIEAFSHSGKRIFDREHIERLRRGCRQPICCGEITADYPTGPKALSNLRFSAGSHGALKIWTPPAANRGNSYITDRYLTVVDIGGRSQGADWSVIAVIDRGAMTEGGLPEIAAQWRGHTDLDLLCWNAAKIAAFYNNSLLVIESNTVETSEGAIAFADSGSQYLFGQLREVYPNLYARKGNEENVKQGVPVRYGFHTNRSTKTIIITTLQKVIRENLYVERDEVCIEEYLTYEERNNGSFGAIDGKHDDILMTRAIGLHICYNEMPAPRRIETEKRNAGFGRYTGGFDRAGAF